MPVHGTERLVLAAPEKVFSGHSGHYTVRKASSSKVVVPAQAPSRCSQRMDIPAGQGVVSAHIGEAYIMGTSGRDVCSFPI